MGLFIKSLCNFEYKGLVLTWYYMDGTLIIEDYSGDTPTSTKRKVGQKLNYNYGEVVQG